MIQLVEFWNLYSFPPWAEGRAYISHPLPLSVCVRSLVAASVVAEEGGDHCTFSNRSLHTAAAPESSRMRTISFPVGANLVAILLFTSFLRKFSAKAYSCLVEKQDLTVRLQSYHSWLVPPLSSWEQRAFLYR